MRHYCARQRQDDKQWDFTADIRDVGPQPIGYCCAYREIDPAVIPISEEEQAKYRATAHKHHTDGHATCEEACECYKEYLLDHRLFLNRTMADQQLRCAICGNWTDKYASLTTNMWPLCPTHNTREKVATLYKAPSDIWVS